MKYSDSPERNRRRVTETSEYCTGRRLWALSKVRVTSAIESGARRAVPPKMMLTIDSERKDFQDISPRHQRTDSMMLDLPQPLGPTTPVMPGLRSTWVLSAKDLKPRISMDFKYMPPLVQSIF